MKIGALKTVGVLTLTAVLVVGGLFVPRYFLDQRQKSMLGRMEELELPDSINMQKTNGVSWKRQNQMTAEWLYGTVSALWLDSDRWLIHTPKEGQLDEEQALQASKDELARMIEMGIIPPRFEKIWNKDCLESAKLQTRMYDSDTHEPNGRSFWQISYCLEGECLAECWMEAETGRIVRIRAEQYGIPKIDNEKEKTENKEKNSTFADVTELVVKEWEYTEIWAEPQIIAENFWNYLNLKEQAELRYIGERGHLESGGYYLITGFAGEVSAEITVLIEYKPGNTWTSLFIEVY